MSDRPSLTERLHSLLGDVDVYFQCSTESSIRDLYISAFVGKRLKLNTSSHNLLLGHDLLSQVLLVVVHVVCS